VLGKVINQADLDHGLELAFRCRVPGFATFRDGVAEIEPLVPALGLRKMYAALASRRQTLALEAEFFESATFRIHLPENVQVSGAMPALQAGSEFGNYSLIVRKQAGLVEARRAFHIPAQLISPDRYPEFVRFTAQIDEVERERITLRRLQQTAKR
jgi:hypothetical protein